MTFNDLKFYAHPIIPGGICAELTLPNNYGISVVQGEGLYSDNDTYEVAILYKDELSYDTPITDDVLKYQTVEDIDNILKELENF